MTQEQETTATTATLRCGFKDFSSEPIENLHYKFVINSETFEGKTDETGATEVLSDIQPGRLVDVWVLREHTKDYKKIGALYAYPGDTGYSIVSPKIKFEVETETHAGEAGNAESDLPPIEPYVDKNSPEQSADSSSDAPSTPPQKPEIKPGRNATGNPQATVLDKSKDWRNRKILAALNFWSWTDFSKPSANIPGTGFSTTPYKASKGHPEINHLVPASKAAEGTPLSKDNLKMLQALIAFTEKQVELDYTPYQKSKNGSASELIISKYNKESSPKFEDKAATKFNGMCLVYVKTALNRANYINGIPGTGPAKNSGRDWLFYGYKEVGKSLPQVEITYEKLHTQSTKSPDKYIQPDLIYTLPGDVIIYEQVDPVETDPPGHIDIRTYHGFLADATRPQPLPALGTSGKKRYKVTGVYRKISDTMAMVRVQAFLRIIREHVAGETSISDKERSYRLLEYIKDSKEPFAMNPDEKLSTHPSDEKKNKPAGAYQIGYRAWNRVIEATGWPKTFSTEMQDRIAMYLLQERPVDFVHHPRRSALGYILEGDIEKAVDLLKQTAEFSNFIGGKKQQLDMVKLKENFDKYTKESAK